MVQESKRHHYVPVFYLGGWVKDGKVCEYSRPHRDVVGKMKAPSATGYEIELYSVPAFPAGAQRVLEDEFFSKVDGIASKALTKMLQERLGPAALSPDLRSGWSRFILSLHYRSPARLAALKIKYKEFVSETAPAYRDQFEARRDPDDKRTFEAFCTDLRHDAAERSWTRLFRSVIDSQRVGDFLNKMLWNVLTVSGSDRKFLTSDHPVVMTNGLDRPDGHLFLPLGPSRLFVATNTAASLEVIKRIGIRQLQRDVNDQVVRQAHRYVYGDDEGQVRFVANRLTRRG
ncbi:DUF4238 domain-containing protein [Sabulicella glaciei]|uniref:DUF4238 domain-containing protein n=1 Tax=Sabulicella glaciei TaxID=2984948 RepID=A0ABT3P0Y8_9PROT|nr:DUF4238 domain-containing protein [Roseococcus sp. MDT2-1-1]MCW8088040.1 DUF4238 domain-containing protein [Roseococcus sp. MDT2-1-1]